MSKKKEAVLLIIPTVRLESACNKINASFDATTIALSALDELDSEYPAIQGKALAQQLVAAGCRWSENTIMQELSRIRRLKKAGKWVVGMTTNEVRTAVDALPKKPRATAAKVANGVSKESAEVIVAKVSREPTDTIAAALVEAIIASGKEDLEDVLKEARRLITQAINAKKKAK